MNWVDFVIVGVILLSALVGYARGLVRELMSLIIWVAALVIAWALHGQVAEMLTAQVAQPTMRIALAFVLVVVVVLLVGSVIASLLTGLVDKTGLTGADRFLGLVFGAARGVVIIAMVVFLAALTPMPDDPWWQESKLMGQFQSVANWMLSLVPEDVQEQLKKL